MDADVSWSKSQKQILEYLSSSDTDFKSSITWSNLGPLVNNGVAKALYVIPIAGYIILYADYFQSWFEFSKLSGDGFLTLLQRVNMAYYGSLVLLLAFLGYLLWSPRLLRGKTDLHGFVATLVTARDLPAIQKAFAMSAEQLDKLPKKEDLVSLGAKDVAELRDVINERLKTGAYTTHDFQANVPNTLRYFYNWQNFKHPAARYFVFVAAFAGYALLAIPALDLFIRVVRTSLKGWLAG